MSDPHDRPQGDAVGGWHEPDPPEQWDHHWGDDGYQLFRVFDLDRLMNPKGPTTDEK